MKYFTIAELTRSETAQKLGFNNEPDSYARANLEKLIENILDPLREAYGAPIHVNSGYRCIKLNQAVKGSTTSYHLFGMAADITAIHKDRSKRIELNKKLFELCRDRDLPFTQLIDEYGYTWIHVAYAPNSKKHQILHLK